MASTSVTWQLGQPLAISALYATARGTKTGYEGTLTSSELAAAPLESAICSSASTVPMGPFSDA